MRKPIRAGWLLVGDERVASARLQGFVIHRELLRLGVHSEILNAPGAFDTRLRWKWFQRWVEAIGHRRDVLLFQKVESSRAVRLAWLARKMGTRIVFVQADARPSPLYELADRVVVSSTELARLLEPICRTPMVVIEDPIDLPREIESNPSAQRDRLRVLWTGSRTNWAALDLVRPILARPEFADLELVTVSDHPEAKVPWSAEAVTHEMKGADLGIIPCLDTTAARAKSNNRLTLLMAAGLPAVASPIPAYRAIVDRGRNGFLAEGSDEWAAALRALRDPALRERIGREARRVAWEQFSPHAIGSRWRVLLEELVGGGS